ncbi:MAG: hypothetical protein Q4E03_01065 [Trueperella sp.]|nr:hypothetical protein [Trueperella sp.]
MSTEIPQWAVQAFVRSAQEAGATASPTELVEISNELLAYWRGPGRYYHTERHLFDLLKRIDTVAPETQNASLVRLAAWGHGVVFSTADQDVYTRNGGENYLASAELATKIYSQIGIPADSVSRIAELITGMRHRPSAEAHSLTDSKIFERIDIDQLALNDAHRGALAAQPQSYKKYLARVCQEYSDIPREHFIATRKEIVTRLLARKHLFLSPLAAQWEQQARENLTAELERLDAILRNGSGFDQMADTKNQLAQREIADAVQAESHSRQLAEDCLPEEYLCAPSATELSRSSLEDEPEATEWATPAAPISADEAAAAQREQIARESRELIEDRQRFAAEKRTANKK